MPGPGQAQNNFNASADVSKELNLLESGSTNVQRGNLLTLPLGGGLVYVQPVYVKSSGSTSFPLLKKVLVAFGDQVGFADTLDEALDQVFGGDSGASAGDAENVGDTTDDKQDESAANSKIVVTNTEWAEVISVVNDAFDNFVVRLQQAYPSLGEKEIGFCCLVKINVNIQDLSDIYCISKAAITKRKYRIKTDKLGITDENISLDSFLKAF